MIFKYVQDLCFPYLKCALGPDGCRSELRISFRLDANCGGCGHVVCVAMFPADFRYVQEHCQHNLKCPPGQEYFGGRLLSQIPCSVYVAQVFLAYSIRTAGSTEAFQRASNICWDTFSSSYVTQSVRRTICLKGRKFTSQNC